MKNWLLPTLGRPEIIPTVPINAHTPSADHAEAPPARNEWARLLKRVFEIDLDTAAIAAAP